MKRRTFIKTTTFAGAASALIPASGFPRNKINRPDTLFSGNEMPIVLSTWNFGMRVPDTAIQTLQNNGSALDAVEKAIRTVEEDPTITSVGRGGYPDRDGHLTLDACVMDENGNAGSVVFLEHIMHPISVARLVMEKTPHVVLAGDGALQFALVQGFKKENLLTDQAKKAYAEWLQKSNYKPPISEKNHDTIGLLVMDASGNISGGCSKSGAAWKMHGRVGDSPLIGAGLYVDNEFGAATATGLGETVIKIAGSFLVVEFMRGGKSPQDACRMTVERLIKKNPQYKNDSSFLAGFIALDKAGDVGAFSYKKGLQYTLHKNGVNKIFDADYLTT